MTSPPLDSIHGQQRRAWNDIAAFGQHTRSDFRRDMRSPPLNNTQWNDVGRGMPSSPLGSTHGRTTSGVACHHRLWEAHTVERHRAWHAIIALRRQTPSNDVQRGMPSPPLGSTNGRTMSGEHAIIALGWQTGSNDVRRGMPSSPLGSTNSQTMSGVACHHSPWTANTVERRQA